MKVILTAAVWLAFAAHASSQTPAGGDVWINSYTSGRQGGARVACATPLYGDVPATSRFCRWIEELTRRGVVTGAVAATAARSRTSPASR